MKALAIVGSRSITPVITLDERPDVIITGGATGVDRCAAEYARINGIDLVEFLPNYEQNGKRAPLIRNTLIAKNCTHILAYWDGESTGTIDVVKKAVRLGRHVAIRKLQADGSFDSISFK